MPQVSLDELRLMFTGEWSHEAQDWAVSPCYHAEIVFEIARRTDTISEQTLRQTLFFQAAPDDIPQEAADAIEVGIQMYRDYKKVAA